ncbi:MAG TPA: ATP-binding protein [Solirubrobacteraceae bacterium]|jgi:signal transduction histidine kinase/ActR/RegA family two-component response regulator|nr:ATP-binding protein [Solirubrobacteraceae bacterium]
MRRSQSWPAVAGTALLFSVLIAYFGVGLADSQSKARHEVVARFSDHAAISAALTHSLFQSSAASEQAASAHLYGGARISPAALTASAEVGGGSDVVILAANNTVLAHSANIPASVTRSLAGAAFVRTALAHRSFALSNAEPLGRSQSVIQFALAFATPYGERVMVSTLPVTALSGFIGGFLAESALRTGGGESSHGFVIDGQGSAIASAGGPVASSGRLEPGLVAAVRRGASGSFGHDRYFVSSPISNSQWSVVLTASQAGLFASVTGSNEWVPWILFAAFALLSVLTLALIARIIRNAGAQRAAVAEAEHANRAKSEFLSRMSHELRTPLNAVIGFGQLLELDELESDQREGVEQILKAGRHLLELINEVLDISRIESGTMSMSLEAVHLGSTVADALSLIRPLADAAGVTLDADPKDLADVYVLADHQRLKQVLINLLSNAVKYNRSGGQVRVCSKELPGNRLELAVADTGQGLSAEQLDRLFEPFDRLGAESGEIEGTGLGLAVSIRLMEAMGGTIRAESQPGAGTTMRIELAQAARAHEAPAPEERAPVLAPGDARRAIVYIEDNLSNLMIVERLVERVDDVRLMPAMQGTVGLDLAREHRPDLVLLDLHLPDMHGRQVLDQLKSDPATAAIPVVILSADATPGQVEQLLAAGAADYLTKPIDIALLLKVIERVFQTHSWHEQAPSVGDYDAVPK